MEDRTPVSRPAAPSAAVPAPTPAGATPAPGVAVDATAKPGIENAGKPGYYTIKPGDTLIRVGLETGQNARDIARWNNIENPNSLEVGQVIRVAPPGVDPAATAARGVNNTRVEGRPLDAKPAAVPPPASTAPAAAGGAAPPALPAPPAVGTLPPVAAATPPPANPPAARDPDDEVNWAWPAAGAVVGNFDEAKSKGLTIGGKAGDPVLAAADGRVVYAGSGLR
ncbi:MAG TPA: LysM peptidoglycan-binding domain-containing protein, partial [Burkholderiaceae bacterium]|nr:LysM peptidoglycan-binding domain-containing protein [Burkholderiaceae bacterium]